MAKSNIRTPGRRGKLTKTLAESAGPIGIIGGGLGVAGATVLANLSTAIGAPPSNLTAIGVTMSATCLATLLGMRYRQNGHEAEAKESFRVLHDEIAKLNAEGRRGRDDIFTRRNDAITFAAFQQNVHAINPRYAVESKVNGDGVVIVNGNIVETVVNARCRVEDPVDWIMATYWPSSAELAFPEKRKEARRVVGTLRAFAALASRPGYTADHIRVRVMQEPEQIGVTSLLTHYAPRDQELVVHYYAPEGVLPGTKAPPEDVTLDPRPAYLKHFRDRWDRIARKSVDYDLDAFLDMAICVCDQGVRMDTGHFFASGDSHGEEYVSQWLVPPPPPGPVDAMLPTSGSAAKN